MIRHFTALKFIRIREDFGIMDDFGIFHDETRKKIPSHHPCSCPDHLNHFPVVLSRFSQPKFFVYNAVKQDKKNSLILVRYNSPHTVMVVFHYMEISARSESFYYVFLLVTIY